MLLDALAAAVLFVCEPVAAPHVSPPTLRRIARRLSCLSLVAVMLGWSPPRGFAQPTRVGMLGRPAFYPTQQNPPRKAESAAVVVRLVGFRAGDDAHPPAFEFESELKNTGEKRTFSVSDNYLVQLDRMYIVNGSKLLLIGRFSSSGCLLMVLDLASGRDVDRFVGFWPEVSPDHQLVAFVKFFPLHFVSDTSDEYLVYDLAASPEGNRTIKSDDKVLKEENAGLPVFPEGSRNVPNDNIGTPEDERHEIASDGFFWVDDRTLAFVDRHKSENSLVVVDLHKGVRQPLLSVSPIDPRDAIDPADIPADMVRHPERSFRVTDIGFSDRERGEVRLAAKPLSQLTKPAARSFRLTLREFRSPATLPTRQ